jgi:hypothetical protein
MERCRMVLDGFLIGSYEDGMPITGPSSLKRGKVKFKHHERKAFAGLIERFLTRTYREA